MSIENSKDTPSNLATSLIESTRKAEADKNVVENTKAVKESAKASKKVSQTFEDIVKEQAKALKTDKTKGHLKELAFLSKKLSEFMKPHEIIKLSSSKRGNQLKGNALSTVLTHKLKSFGVDIYGNKKQVKPKSNTKSDEASPSIQAKPPKVSKTVAPKLTTHQRLLNTKNKSLEKSLLNYLSPSNVAYLVDNALDPQELNDILSSELTQQKNAAVKPVTPKVAKTPLTKQQKTVNAAKKQLSDKVVRLSGQIVNEIGQTGLDKLIYDQNGNEIPDNILVPILEAKISDIKLAKNPSKASIASTPLTAQQKILHAAKNQRVKDAGKYGQVLLGRMGETKFNSLTSGKSDDEVVNMLMNLRDVEIQSLQTQQKIQSDNNKFNKDFLAAEKDNKAFDKTSQKLAKEESNKKARAEKENARLLKEAQKHSISQSKALLGVLANIVSPNVLGGRSTGGSFLGNIGMGALGGMGGLLGAGVGLAGGLLGKGIGGAVGGIGGLIGRGGFGDKHTVPTKVQSRIMGLSGGLAGKYSLGKAGKYGGLLGGGVAKVGGKVASGLGGILGSVGLTSLVKKVPYLNAILGAYSVGEGIYDAYQTTDNPADFLKESAWNTVSNLASMATFGMVDADVIEKYAKKLAGYTTDKIDQSGLVQGTVGHFHKLYMNEFGISLAENLDKGQQAISLEEQIRSNDIKTKAIEKSYSKEVEDNIRVIKRRKQRNPYDPMAKMAIERDIRKAEDKISNYVSKSMRSRNSLNLREGGIVKLEAVNPINVNNVSPTIIKKEEQIKNVTVNNINYNELTPQMEFTNTRFTNMGYMGMF